MSSDKASTIPVKAEIVPSIQRLVAYLEADEWCDYELCKAAGESTSNHIYHAVVAVKDYFGTGEA